MLYLMNTVLYMAIFDLEIRLVFSVLLQCQLIESMTFGLRPSMLKSVSY